MSNIAAVPVINKKGDLAMQPAKVIRYRRGVAPEGVRESDDEEHSSEEAEEPDNLPQTKQALSFVKVEQVQPTPYTRIDVPLVDIQQDARLQRLKASVEASHTRYHRLDADEDLAPMRRKILDDEDALQATDSEESIASNARTDESSEEDTESSEEEAAVPRPRAKPVFISRNGQNNSSNLPSIQEQLTASTIVMNKEDRRQETLQLVQSEKARERSQNVDDQSSLVDDDGADPDAEYAKWEQRELNRLRRNRAERLAWEKQEEELERRRNMTDAERRAEEERVRQETEEAQQNKPKMKFLQKYFHKGAFYLEEDKELLQRNYMEATGDDQFNREVLPEILQKRNFGKSSQSKWTHLTNEDTSRRDAGWEADHDLLKRLDRKRGGMGDIDGIHKRRR